MWGSESVRSHLLDVALARINKFVHVGSTGRLMDSVAAAAVRNLKRGGREQGKGRGKEDQGDLVITCLLASASSPGKLRASLSHMLVLLLLLLCCAGVPAPTVGWCCIHGC